MLVLILSLFCMPFAMAAPSVPAGPLPELVIYTYDSLVAKHGLGPVIFPLFEKTCGCKVRALSSGDGGQILTRLQLDAERGRAVAHLVLGLDQAIWERAKPWLESWDGWEPRGYRKLLPQTKIGTGFLPFDFGVFAFMADTEALTAAKLVLPTRLSDLLRPEWKRNLILEDPRTSTPGLAFLLYANEVNGSAAAPGFWRKFRSQWLTLAPGWDGAYGLFLKKEAPMVWSYTTSQAYHELHGDRGDGKRRYRAVVFEEGQPFQVEGAALVKGALDSKTRALARNFLEFMISPAVQAKIPLGNWMLPALAGVKLPPSFKKLPQPKKLVHTPVEPLKIEAALTSWRSALDSTP